MIQIVITSPEVREFKGVSKNTGKDYHLRIQTAHAFTCDDNGTFVEFPDKFEISLDRDQPPYARGKYQLQPSSLYVSRDGRLELRPRLAPLAAK